MFCCSCPISGEAPGYGNTFVFVLLNVVLYSKLPHWLEGLCILRQKSSLCNVCRQTLLGTILHIMQKAFFFFLPGGCRAAQFRNIRQEQMKRTCLLVGGKCQLHSPATPLFVFTGGNSIIFPLILSHCEEK